MDYFAEEELKAMEALVLGEPDQGSLDIIDYAIGM